ncbi:RBR-type E3 ubiquitin transferase [Favolaschia claudopus]|uniref:Protein PBN1 n=1 Tax=Favolaschia claudopus TaxID=2862362 RepID=A0AAW0CKL2_9AGAR
MQSSSLLHPHSYHPVFRTRISASGHENCTLNLYYELPPLIFVDPYELSNRADTYSYKYAGSSNLELPVFALGEDDSRNSTLLVTGVETLSREGVLEVEVPLHTRYAHTSTTGTTFQETKLSWPDAFLACSLSGSTSRPRYDSELPKMPTEFVVAFEAKTIVRLWPLEGVIPVETVSTPIGNTADVSTVELGTAVVIISAFLFLVHAVRRTVARIGSTTTPLSAKKQ